MAWFETLVSVVAAAGTLGAAYFTWQAAISSQESAKASEKSAQIAHETMELSRRADVIATAGGPSVLIKWSIEASDRGSLPILSLDGARHLLSVVNAGAGHAFDVRMKVESITADPNEFNRTDYGGTDGSNSEVFVRHDQTLLARGWFHVAQTAVNDEAAKTVSITPSAAFGSSRMIEAVGLPDSFLRDIAYGALAQLRATDPPREVWSLEGKVIRKLRVTGTFRGVDGQQKVLPEANFAVKIVSVEIDGPGGTPVVRDRVYHAQEVMPVMIPMKWHEARIKLSVEHDL